MLSLERGGGETFDLEMARHLAQLGCEVTMLSGLPLFGRRRLGPKEWWGKEISDFECRMSNLEKKERISKVGFRISDIKDVQVRTPHLGWLRWDKIPGAWRLRVSEFKAFEKAAARWAFRHRDQFDVIQVCELPFFVDAYKKLEKSSKKKTPISMRLTAPDFYDPRRALQRADMAIASGTTMEMMRAGARPDCENVTNGVDVDLFHPHETDFRTRQGWSDDDFVIVFVARFQSVKNHAMLLNAFRQLLKAVPNARLVLAGSGPLEDSIRALAKQLDIEPRVSFLGEMPFRDVSDLYASADVGVVSSDYESFSFVALESMASGLPMVVTATQWVPRLIGASDDSSEIRDSKSDIVQLPGGFVVPVGDAEAFAGALKMLADDRALGSKMGQWNRERVVRDFIWSASAEKLLGLYERLVAKSSEGDALLLC